MARVRQEAAWGNRLQESGIAELGIAVPGIAEPGIADPGRSDRVTVGKCTAGQTWTCLNKLQSSAVTMPMPSEEVLRKGLSMGQGVR